MATNPRLFNTGYLLVGKETTPGVAVTPTIALPVYDETLTTSLNLDSVNPVSGNRAARYDILPGMRDHKGDITAQAEPNTTAFLLDAALTRQSTTSNGDGTFTHVFKGDSATDPHSYTYDIAMGNNLVARFFGVGLSKLGEEYSKTEKRWKASASALGSFYGREIASISGTGTGPYTIVLTTTYDPSPTTGLVASDLIRFMTSATNVTNATADATVLAVTNGTTFTTTGVNLTTAGVIAGDVVHLRAQTATQTWLAPYLWPLTYWFQSTTAALALTASATTTNQTRFETGSAYTIENKFQKDTGEDRSGAFDPAALIRTEFDISLKNKRIFDTPDQMKIFMAQNKIAWVIKQISNGAAGTLGFPLVTTINNTKIAKGAKPGGKSDAILYADMEYTPKWDNTDGQMYSVSVTNQITTV